MEGRTGGGGLALANTAMNLRVPQKAGNCFGS